MPIDPSIPLGFRNPQIQVQNPLAQYAQAQELNLNALKMQQAKQGMETRNMLRSLDPSSPEYINQISRMDPKLGLELSKGRATIKKEEGLTAKNAAELEGQYIKNSRNTLVGVKDQAAYDSWRTDTISKMPGLAEVIPAQFSPQVKAALLSDAETYLKQNTISEYQKQSLGVQREGQAITREGQRMQYDPQLQANIAEAKAAGEFMGKNKATAAAALPSALEAAKEGIRLIDEMVGKAPVVKDGKVIEKGTAPHPGFKNYVGAALVPGMRFVEGSDTASFEVRQKQIEGKAFLEAFQTLKGGGAITEKEGEKGTAAIMRMNKASNEREYTAAARELQGVLRTGMDRARAKAGGASAAPSGGVIDFNSLN